MYKCKERFILRIKQNIMKIDNNKIEYCEEEEDYFIETDEGRYYLEPDDILKQLKQVKENELLHSVSDCKNRCKQCKKEIDEPYRFCSGECKAYYNR